MRPLTLLASVSTTEGELQLRRRAPNEFLITIDGRVLMASSDRRSEEAVATLACKAIASVKAPRVLIGGLGMAYTLRAALDALPTAAHITVAELTAEVETWCRAELAPLTDGAVHDPRVTIVIVTYNSADVLGDCLASIELHVRDGRVRRSLQDRRLNNVVARERASRARGEDAHRDRGSPPVDQALLCGGW